MPRSEPVSDMGMLFACEIEWSRCRSWTLPFAAAAAAAPFDPFEFTICLMSMTTPRMLIVTKIDCVRAVAAYRRCLTLGSRVRPTVKLDSGIWYFVSKLMDVSARSLRKGIRSGRDGFYTPESIDPNTNQ